jgi:hypothetical protein
MDYLVRWDTNQAHYHSLIHLKPFLVGLDHLVRCDDRHRRSRQPPLPRGVRLHQTDEDHRLLPAHQSLH